MCRIFQEAASPAGVGGMVPAAVGTKSILGAESRFFHTMIEFKSDASGTSLPNWFIPPPKASPRFETQIAFEADHLRAAHDD
jgi:hypothetical protein